MTETNSNKELSALINLLDEPDENAFNQIRKKIYSFGKEAIPLLEGAWETSFDEIVQERVELIINQIQQEMIRNELYDWVTLGSSDLMKGFMLVTRTQYPEIDQEKIIQQIEQIKMDAWLELNDNLTALENIKVLNHILFEVHRFEANRADLQMIQNSFIHTLLETRKGSPLSLGILYIIIAQKLNIPIYGVNLPQHFILAYTTEMVKPHPDENDVLFYINPFNKGAVFTRREIDLFIRQLKVKPEESFFAPCTNIEIIKRLILYLKFVYTQSGNPDKAEEFEVLLKIIE
jgi:regulator of sirC expression with transglutaminase-like and TPR domain